MQHDLDRFAASCQLDAIVDFIQRQDVRDEFLCREDRGYRQVECRFGLLIKAYLYQCLKDAKAEGLILMLILFLTIQMSDHAHWLDIFKKKNKEESEEIEETVA